jgi:hypothetical protein
MTIQITYDDYKLIQIVKEVLSLPEEKAVTTLIEIGLENMLAYPSVPKRVYDILSQPKFQILILKIKQVWLH